MLPIARRLLNDGQCPILLLLNPNEIDQEEVDHYKNEGGLILMVQQLLYSDKDNKSKGLLYRLLPYLFKSSIDYFIGIMEKKKSVNYYLENNNIVALVLMSDRIIGWETVIIREANKRKIPSLIVPVSLSFPDAAAEYRLSRSNWEIDFGMRNMINRMVAILFPDWVYEYKEQRLLFIPGYQALIAWLLGVMPQKPWTLGGGSASRMGGKQVHV